MMMAMAMAMMLMFMTCPIMRILPAVQTRADTVKVKEAKANLQVPDPIQP